MSVYRHPVDIRQHERQTLCLVRRKVENVSLYANQLITELGSFRLGQDRTVMLNRMIDCVSVSQSAHQSVNKCLNDVVVGVFRSVGVRCDLLDVINHVFILSLVDELSYVVKDDTIAHVKVWISQELFLFLLRMRECPFVVTRAPTAYVVAFTTFIVALAFVVTRFDLFFLFLLFLNNIRIFFYSTQHDLLGNLEC